MEVKFFEMIPTLGTYKSHQCSQTVSDKSDYVIEVSITPTSSKWNHVINVTLYTKGKLVDYAANGWSVCPIAKGEIGYQRTSISANLIAPDGKRYGEFNYFSFYESNSKWFERIAEMFLSHIFLITACKDVEQYKDIVSILYNTNSVGDELHELSVSLAKLDYAYKMIKEFDSNDVNLNKGELVRLFQEQLGRIKERLGRLEVKID